MEAIMRVLALLVALGTLAASNVAGAFSIAYDLPAPTLNANQTIDGLALQFEVLSSVAGRNGKPADPALATRLVPNPLNPGQNVPEPLTTDGVDPGTGRNAQFFYVPGSFAIEDRGNNMNTNDRFPGVPAGTTTRIDTVGLQWDALKTPVVFGARNQLRFGASLNVQRLFYTNPAPLRTLPAYRTTVSNPRATWILNDGSIPAGVPAATMQLGLNSADPSNGNVILGLSFAYLNSAPTDILLSDLSFLTSLVDLPLDDLTGGNMLSDPMVTLDGIPQMLQSVYDIPVGSSIQFLFPQTSDLFFTVTGDISADGVTTGFAFEDQVALAEPRTAALFMLGLVVAMLVQRRRVNVSH
jgi:hypothetical protein